MLRHRLRGKLVRVELKQVQAREVKGTISAVERLGTICARVRKM